MSYAAVSLGVAGGSALIGTGLNLYNASKQRKRAREINPIDPGPNQALIDNANLLRNRYGNYNMPGYSEARGQIGQAGATGFRRAAQGATSSGDILDAATRISYGTQKNLADLNVQNAVAREQALADYLGANAAAGADETAWGRQRYLQDRQDRANLMNAADINTSNAINEGLGTIGTAGAYYFGDRERLRRLDNG